MKLELQLEIEKINPSEIENNFNKIITEFGYYSDRTIHQSQKQIIYYICKQLTETRKNINIEIKRRTGVTSILEAFTYFLISKGYRVLFITYSRRYQKFNKYRRFLCDLTKNKEVPHRPYTKDEDIYTVFNDLLIFNISPKTSLEYIDNLINTHYDTSKPVIIIEDLSTYKISNIEFLDERNEKLDRFHTKLKHESKITITVPN
jgi:hypothetical protein